MDRKKIGQYYEKIARHYLENKGLVFIAENIFIPNCGEIDLIMQESDILVFIEVRYRKNLIFGSALESITYIKQKKIKQTAAYWLSLRNKSLNDTLCRFDILAITGNQVQWVPNAFQCDD